jgi:hypothetical protein
MLGRKDFTADEIAAAKDSVQAALTAFAEAGSPPALETVFFNDAVLALDRRFVHRVRMVTGKDGTPLNELELIATSLMDHGGKFQTNTVIKYVPASSVLGLSPGDPIALTAEQFAQLAAACFDELETKFR